MKRIMLTATIMIVAVASVAVVAHAATQSRTVYYWTSFDAQMKIENSDWGDARGVANASCAGKGRFVKEYTQFKFATFRCELKDKNFERIGFVTVKTTAPEAWKPVGYVRPRCPV